MPASPGLDAARLRRVLVVKLSSLGDVVHSLPLLDALRDGLGPDAHIGWAVERRFADLVRGNPNVSALYELDKKGFREVRDLGRRLREAGFDAALDAQGLLVSGAVARLSGAPVRVGWDANREGNRLFLTHPVVPYSGRRHVTARLLGFCDALGLARTPPRPQTYLANAEATAADALLAEVRGGPIIGCIVGASTADKVWPAERWAEAARLLAADGLRVALLGAKGEAATAANIVQQAGPSAGVTNLVGRTATPRVLASVLARCAVVVGGDSGPTHLAVAVGTPVVGLYGVTDPERTGPQWGPASAVVLDFAEADAPPAARRPRHATLPDALARIPAAAVRDAVRSLLGAPSPQGTGGDI